VLADSASREPALWFIASWLAVFSHGRMGRTLQLS
jgi:hypothetical protein